jgi:FlaA1/EpsC-like NDP-sugar epimerase
MFNVRVYLTNACLACFDLAVTAACYFAVQGAQPGTLVERAARPLAVLIVWLLLSFYFGMYRSRRLDSLFVDMVIIFKVSLVSLLLIHAGFAILSINLAAFSMAGFVATNFVALTVARSVLRVCLRELRRRGHNVKRLALIASPQIGRRLEEKIGRRSYYGYRIIQRFDYIEGEEEPGFLQNVTEFVRSTPIDDVIVALPVHAKELSGRMVAECEAQGINVRIVPDLFPLIRTDTQIYDFDGIPLVNARLYPTEFVGYVVFKRTFDICISVLVLTLLSPLFLLLSLLIRATSPGPVFFTQDRV